MIDRCRFSLLAWAKDTWNLGRNAQVLQAMVADLQETLWTRAGFNDLQDGEVVQADWERIRRSTTSGAPEVSLCRDSEHHPPASSQGLTWCAGTR